LAAGGVYGMWRRHVFNDNGVSVANDVIWQRLPHARTKEWRKQSAMKIHQCEKNEKKIVAK